MNSSNNLSLKKGMFFILVITLLLSFQTSSNAQSPRIDWSVKMCDSILDRYTPGSFGDWKYSNALALIGMWRVYGRTQNEDYYTFIKGWVDRFVDENGLIGINLNSLDNMYPGILLCLLYQRTNENKYKTAADQIRARLDSYPRTSDGAFVHVDRPAYNGELWQDGVFMVTGFLIHYGQVFNDAVYANDECARQIALYDAHLKRDEDNLGLHAWDEDRSASWADPGTGLSPESWCRANGWFIMACIETLAILPPGHSERSEIISILYGRLGGMKNFQDDVTGLWYEVIDKGDDHQNWVEQSSSSMVAYAMSTAMEKGYVPAIEFHDNAKKAYAGILSNIELNDAKLTDIYGTVRGTHVGDYNYYVNQPQLVNDPHGIGAFLICNEQMRNQFPVLFKTFQAENAFIHRGVEESTNRGFTGASYVNGHNEAGSYIEWEVHASQAGTFALTIRYANGTDQNRFCDVDINGGQSHINDLDFNGTKAWTLWEAQTCQINLNQGANTIRITADQTNGPPNIDWIGFEDYVSAPVEEYQAEEAFIYHGSIDSDHPGYTGDGFVNYDNEIGSYVAFDVQAQTSGTYMLIFRYANGTNQNRFCDVDVNGELLINNVSFEGTGAWENWFTQTCRVFLHSGANIIYLTADQSNGGPNLDRMDVLPVDGALLGW